MEKKNNIPISEIETKAERYWFSIIKEFSKDVNFGTINVQFTIKNGQITNLQKTEIKKSYNISASELS